QVADDRGWGLRTSNRTILWIGGAWCAHASRALAPRSTRTALQASRPVAWQDHCLPVAWDVRPCTVGIRAPAYARARNAGTSSPLPRMPGGPYRSTPSISIERHEPTT